MVDSNPLFLLVREEGIALFSRFFDYYLWLRTSQGDQEMECYLDLRELEHFPEIKQFHLDDQKWFDTDTAVYSIPSLFLRQEPLSYSMNPTVFSVDASMAFTVNKEFLPSPSINTVSFSLQSIWTAFLKKLFRSWWVQNSTISTHLFLVVPDAISDSAYATMEKGCSDAGISTVIRCSPSQFLVSPSHEYQILLDISDTVLEGSILSSRGVVVYRSRRLLKEGDTFLSLLTNHIFSAIHSERISLAEELRIKRSIRLQCRYHLERLSEESPAAKTLFIISIHHRILSKRLFCVTTDVVQTLLKDSPFLVILGSLMHSLASFASQLSSMDPSIVVSGMLSHLSGVQQSIQTVLPSFTIDKLTLQKTAQRVSQAMDEQQPSLCNHFSFLDHNLSLAIQDGFSCLLISKGTPLPTLAHTVLQFNLARTSTVTLMLLRGDGYKQEDNLVVISQSLYYSNQEESVEITVELTLDVHCNCTFVLRDSFGQVKTTSLSSSDFFNVSIERPHTDLYTPVLPPICGRQDHCYYQGEMVGFQPSGFGRYYDSSSSLKYEGQWSAGQFEGRGMYFFYSGNVFDGSFRNGKLDGPGVLYDDQGIVIERGYFDHQSIDDPPPQPVSAPSEPVRESETSSPSLTPSHTITMGGSGYGTVRDSKGAVIYEGELENGVFQGIGSLFYEGVLKYKGGFDQGFFSGKGTLYYPSGNVHCIGSFFHNKREGYCQMFFDSPSRTIQHSGFFVNDKREGQGTDFSSSGTVSYQGCFHRGVRCTVPPLLVWSELSDRPRVALPDGRLAQSLAKRESLVLSIGGLAVKPLREQWKDPKVKTISVNSRVDESG